MSIWIRTEHELAEWVASLAGCTQLALDTESDSLYHFRERVCLVQVAAAGQPARLIDSLALPSLALLDPVLANPAIEIVLHGADYDVTTCKRDFGWQFVSLFDTMLAARFCGRTAFGLQALVASELGVTISKGAQKDDWSRRPLTQTQERYALADVEHLIALKEKLAAELVSLGRLAWLREESDAVAALPAAQRRQEPNAYQKIKGARDLGPRGLAILRELFLWREQLAEKIDRPPFKVMQPTTLLELAEHPRGRDELQRLPELRRQPRHLPEVLAAIERGLAVPDDALPEFERQPWPKIPGEKKARMTRLQKLRDQLAAEAKLDPSLVLSQRLIEKVAELAPRTVEELARVEGFRRWRATTWGAAIVAVL